MPALDPLEICLGTSEAESFLLALRANLNAGDELFEWLIALKHGTNDDRLRGAARHLQKVLERAR